MRSFGSQPEYEAALLQRAASWKTIPTLESLSAEALQEITLQEGIDFATTLLFHRFQHAPSHSAFIQQIDHLRQHSFTSRQCCGIKVVVVPGALYLERPDMGGDGRLIREVASNLGYKTELVPLASQGRLAANARLLAAWLSRNDSEQTILVSLSKGGADVKLALAAPDAPHTFRQVVAWVNVCGPLDGSRMVDWILSSRWRTWLMRMQYRWQRRDFQFITDLRHSANAPLQFQLNPPPAMRIVSLVGFPLRRHLTTALSRFAHRTLAKWGPNDGTISLSDLAGWPGEIYPAWGADHYFRPEPLARDLIAAVLNYLAQSPALQLRCEAIS